MAITNLDTVPLKFVNGGRMNIFDSLTDTEYATATLASLVNPKYIGQIVNGTTSSAGEEASVTNILDEEGGLIIAKHIKGNMGYNIEIASTSSYIIEQFMKGAELTATFTEDAAWASGTAAHGWGRDLPIFTAPIAIEDQSKAYTIVHPKCSIISSVGISGEGLFTVKAIISVLDPESPSLQPNIMVKAGLKKD